jgi:beta propeller repeat protein
MPLEGKRGIIRKTGRLTVTGVSTIEDGGHLILDGGALEYKAGRLNINDGGITILDGAADFGTADPIMLCDNYGPSNINISGGTMTVRSIESRMAYRGGKITVGGGTLVVERIDPGSSERDPSQWLLDGVLAPDKDNGYREIVITGWGDGGAKITAAPKGRIVEAGGAALTIYEKDLDLNMGAHSRYGDVSGSRVVFAHGPDCDFTWDIKCKDLGTEKRTFYRSGSGNKGKHLDIHPRIDGDILVWSGGALWRQAGGVWGHEPLNLGVLARNLATGKQKALREHTMSECYSHPAVSGNIVVWVEHLSLDTTPLGSQQARNWYNTAYNICGADVTDLDNPEYFIVDTNVGNRDPYTTDFDDVVDISGRIVVWEGRGDIYGADVSDLKGIKDFPICIDPGRQFDAAISDDLVVWSDTRNDEGDIYGADISNREGIKVFPIVSDSGTQQQPAIDGRTIVYVDDGQIKVRCLTKENKLLPVPLSKVYQGAGPAIDGDTIVWQSRSGDKVCARGISLEFSYCLTAGADAGK